MAAEKHAPRDMKPSLCCPSSQSACTGQPCCSVLQHVALGGNMLHWVAACTLVLPEAAESLCTGMAHRRRCATIVRTLVHSA